MIFHNKIINYFLILYISLFSQIGNQTSCHSNKAILSGKPFCYVTLTSDKSVYMLDFTWCFTIEPCCTRETRGWGLEFRVIIEGSYGTRIWGAAGGAQGAVVSLGAICGGHNPCSIDSKRCCSFNWITIAEEKNPNDIKSPKRVNNLDMETNWTSTNVQFLKSNTVIFYESINHRFVSHHKFTRI